MKKLPTHLLIVSCVFLLIGIMALLRTVDSLFYSNRPSIDFFVVFLVMGIGLLRRNDLARKFAIYCCLVMLIFQICVVALLLTGRRIVAADTFGTIVFWLYTGLTIAASAYGLWVLQFSAARTPFRKD